MSVWCLAYTEFRAQKKAKNKKKNPLVCNNKHGRRHGQYRYLRQIQTNVNTYYSLKHKNIYTHMCMYRLKGKGKVCNISHMRMY